MDGMTTMPSGSTLSVPAFDDHEVSAVRLREVHKNFGPVQAVRGVDLTIGSGEILAFLGPTVPGRPQLSTSSWASPNQAQAKSRSMA